MKRGFSLLEVLVAMVMLVTVATVIMGSFQQSFRVRDHSHKVFDRYKDVRMAMHRMAREISMAYLSKHHSANESTTASWFEGDDDELHFLSFAFTLPDDGGGSKGGGGTGGSDKGSGGERSPSEVGGTGRN